MAKTYDLVIRGARVVDGTGQPARSADVAISGDTICEVGSIEPSQDSRVLEASGLVLAPGFIDAWAELDPLTPVFPQGESKLLQGVTSEAQGAGNRFPFPLAECDPLAGGRPEDTAFIPDWTDARGFLLKVAKTGTGLNRAFFAGYGAIREVVAGRSAGLLTRDEAKRVWKELELALEAGCLGLAVDLTEPPAAFASLDELVEVARQLASSKAVLAVVLRDRGPAIERAVEEVLEIASRSGVELFLPELRLTGAPNWGKIDWLESRLKRAMDDGISLTVAVEPYTAWPGALGSVLPPALSGERGSRPSREELLKALESRAAGDDRYWERITLACPKGEGQGGRATLAELAASRKRPPAELLLELIVERPRERAHFHEMNEGNLERMLSWSFTAIGSGEPARPVGTRFAPDHPRGLGTFPRVLRRYVREKKLLSLEEAVRRMTSLPAERLGLPNRGRIEPGCVADIVLFRPDIVSDGATFSEPSALPAGIYHVLVAGALVVKDGSPTSELRGRILRRTGC